MRRFISLLWLLALLVCFPLFAQAEVTLAVEPAEYAFTYTVTSDTEQFLLLLYEGKNEKGQKVLYLPEGSVTGTLPLIASGEGGKLTVTIRNLKQHQQAKASVQLPRAADYAAPTGASNATVKELTLTATATGFRYRFTAPGTDYMLLYYRTKQQSLTMPVYPADETGLYEGEIVSDLTYARALFTVQVRTGKGTKKKEETVRKEFEAPAAPQPQEGRLSGVVVCVDPGHQENGQFVNEPIGPGLSGSSAGKGGMAQGKTTLRKEDIVCLEIGMKLRDELIRQGATVVMTREVQDIFHTNRERCQIAADAGADIMLRLHCNNVSNKNKQGVQVYGPLNSDYARAVAEPDVYRQMGELLLNALKSRLGYELKDATGGVRLNDNYIGNNWAQMTCFLVEMGYMSNVEEDFLLATSEYQQMVAEGLADGVYEIAKYRSWIETEE